MKKESKKNGVNFVLQVLISILILRLLILTHLTYSPPLLTLFAPLPSPQKDMKRKRELVSKENVVLHTSLGK